MLVELRVTAGPHEGRVFSFDRHAASVVGRASDAQCPMPEDRFLSRHHFLIEFNPPVCSVRDLGSTNGIRLNGVRVESARLYDGDLIAAGNSVFTVDMESSDQLRVVCRGCAIPASLDVTLSRIPGEPVVWFCPDCAASRRRFPRAPRGYWIEKWIGGGGMGEVFLARREADNLPLALKVMIPIVAASRRARRYFLREMNVLANLRHRNIVAFYEAIEEDGQFMLLMEYVDAKGAREWVDTLDGPPPVSAVAAVGVQLLSALDHAHRRGFVHRDIKPSNVLVMGSARAPRVKLSDFGLAKNFRDDAGFHGLTTEGDFGGSMGFLSPDQIHNFRVVKGAVRHLQRRRHALPPAGRHLSVPQLRPQARRGHPDDPGAPSRPPPRPPPRRPRTARSHPPACPPEAPPRPLALRRRDGRGPPAPRRRSSPGVGSRHRLPPVRGRGSRGWCRGGAGRRSRRRGAGPAGGRRSRRRRSSIASGAAVLDGDRAAGAGVVAAGGAEGPRPRRGGPRRCGPGARRPGPRGGSGR